MQPKSPAFIEALVQDASAAEIAELELRKSVAQEIAARERRRQFAYRRLDLARTMLAALRVADNEETALAAGAAAFKRELTWNTETEARKRVLAAWAPVVTAIWRAQRERASATAADASGPTPEAAIMAFEAWYEVTHTQPFLATFDVELPELPVVEF